MFHHAEVESGMVSIIKHSKEMGNFALLWLGITVIGYLILAVSVCVIGGIYDIYLFFKYLYKGISWLIRKCRRRL